MVHITGLIQNSVQKKFKSYLIRQKHLILYNKAIPHSALNAPLVPPGLEHIDNALEVPSGLCENTVLSMKNGD